MSGRALFGSSKRGRLKQASRIWHKKLKADMEELGFVQCQRDHAIFCHGKWGSPDWAVYAFWVDHETGVGSCHQLDRVALMFNQKYRISGKGEMRWTLRIGVAHDHDTHIISLSQEEYINNLFRPKMQTPSPPCWNPAQFSPRNNAQQHQQSCKACPPIGIRN